MYKVTVPVFSFLLIAFCACNNAGKNSNIPVTQPVKTDSPAININYVDSKTGDTVLFFIHGWGINQTYWKNQFTAFSKNYRVVTIDLPGFGKSVKNSNNPTIENYSKDISAVLNTLNLKNVILIGHSMSGAIVVETALTNPSRIIGIVGVDNLKDIGIVITPQMQLQWDEFYKAARQHFKKAVSENMMQYLFSPSTGSAIKERVTADILGADTTMAVNCLENADKYPFTKKLPMLNKPLCLINSELTATDTAVFYKSKIDFALFNIGLTGHYPMLEKPDMFNLLLQKAIDKICNRKLNIQPD